MADRLREEVAQIALPVASSNVNLSCTVSVGVSRPCEAAHRFAATWRETDQALRAAKDAGRVRGQLVAVPRTVRPFVRGAGSLRPRVTEIALRQAG